MKEKYRDRIKKLQENARRHQKEEEKWHQQKVFDKEKAEKAEEVYIEIMMRLLIEEEEQWEALNLKKAEPMTARVTRYEVEEARKLEK